LYPSTNSLTPIGVTGAAPVPLATQVNWTGLSPRSLATLARIAVPISLGLSHAEVALQTGIKESVIKARMKLLREEIREQQQA
jgi:hypothetical protein